ncbi:hypothetical protein [Aquaticitalea lipolytica]|uniref:hypothetical protein n=1 Tax=Aquaticitalea lipolytica TaxID=1247562 RepID=UPI0024B9E88B|nr:hypothetical protein [Aquaticitalea lipolytica]
MIKKLVVVLIVAFASQLQAQEGTASPYSFYGIGSLKFKGTVENRSMGGLSIYNDSIHLNLLNPAGYTGNNIKSFNNESRPVKFAIGGSYSSLNLKSDSGSEKANSTTFDYLALSVPMGKFGFGFGLLPYTSVGYKLESRNDNDDVSNRYRGEGGVNKAFAGLAYQINEKLSVGVEASYNFGNVKNSSVAYLYDDEGNLVQYQSRENNRSDLSGLNFNIGLSYKTMINDKLELSSGLTYAPGSNLTSNNTRSFSTIIINEISGQEFVVNTIDADLEAQNLKTTDLSLPSRVSFGAGIGEPRKWFLGAEYTYQNTSKFSNPIFSIDNATFVNASTIALGGFYIPDYNSFSNYWKRVTYRGGLHYENTGLEINNETINEFGMSFGVGLPVGGLFSNANLGLEFGKRGTTNQNLIQENFINLQISLSLNDRWFQKRKYN